MNKILFSFLFFSVLAGCGGEDEGLLYSDELPSNLSSIRITPKPAVVPVGFDVLFATQAILLDGSIVEITDTSILKWNSENESIATVDNDGRASGIQVGTSKITVSGTYKGEVYSDSSVLTVTASTVTGLDIEPESTELPVGLSQQLEAFATFSGGEYLNVTNHRAVHWKSSDNSIASIDNNAEVTGVSIGLATATATATANGVSISDTSTINVLNATITNFQILPETVELPVGSKAVFKPVVTLSNGATIDVTGSSSLLWSSSNMAIATIDDGTVTALSQGSSTIESEGVSGNFRDEALVLVNNSDFTIEAEDLKWFGDSTGARYTSLTNSTELAYPSISSPTGITIGLLNKFFGANNLGSTLDGLTPGDRIYLSANIDTDNNTGSISNALLKVNFINEITGATIVVDLNCTSSECSTIYTWTANNDAGEYDSIIFKADIDANGNNVIYDSVSVGLR